MDGIGIPEIGLGGGAVCPQLRYTHPQGEAKYVNVIAVDRAGQGVNAVLETIKDLTVGKGLQLGSLRVQAKESATLCLWIIINID